MQFALRTLQFWGLWNDGRLIVFWRGLFNGIHNSSLRRTSKRGADFFVRQKRKRWKVSAYTAQ